MPRPVLPSAFDLFASDDPTAALHRSHDWAATSLGPIENWSPTLVAAVRTVIPSRVPMLLWLGPDLVQVYNHSSVSFLGDKHPGGVGQPAAECWSDVWPDVDRLVSDARSGWSTFSRDLRLMMRRHGFEEETFWTFSYSPVRGSDGDVEAIFVATTDTTAAVVRRRRLEALSRLRASSRQEATSITAALQRSVDTLVGIEGDVSGASAHLRRDGVRFEQVAVAGEDQPDHPTADAARAEVVEHGDVLEIAHGAGGPGHVRHTVHLPIVDRARDETVAVLSLSIGSHRALDDDYRTFLDLFGHRTSSAVTDAAAYSREHARARALALTDRARTRFLQNISHELRTPLALIHASQQSLLDDADITPGQLRAIERTRRAADRLTGLVEGLLEIARAEGYQATPQRVPTPIDRLTTEIASMFESAVKEAGLTMTVDVQPLPEPVLIDPAAWERIVSNLVSNALKYTPTGSITVSLSAADDELILSVEDTGVGIPTDEIHTIFERFHRIDGRAGRAGDGAGIGLALVRDAAVAHGGSVRVDSTAGAGSTFTVTIPHHRSGGDTDAEPDVTVGVDARGRVAEATAWRAPDPSERAPTPNDDTATAGRILVVEDNANMRDMIAELLAADGWEVDAVADVPSALGRPDAPDLVLSDVMLPGADGLDLVRALRAADVGADVPIILLTARGGPESATAGLAAGADDYLTKPFDTEELKARVRGHVDLSRRRRQALDAVTAKRDNLEIALDSNRRIGAAVGIVMATHGVDEDAAFGVLRRLSQDQNRKLSVVAEEIVAAGSSPPTAPG